MYKVVPFSDDLDLEEFYSKAKAKGFENNSSRFWLKDCFRNERESQTWILYYNDKPVGSVAAHSFDDMGADAYRIAVRTCVFSDELPINNLRTLKGITSHQNATAQFLIPTCIEWAGRDKRLFITSNDSEVGSQRLVHKIFFPALEKTGQAELVCEMEYRGTWQSVWQLNVSKFYEELEKHGKWQK
jgi:hypothetical protein